MKRLIFSILSLCTLLPFVSEAQEVVNDSKRRNWSDDEPLYGNVESIRIFTYLATATDYAEAGTITNDITYRFNDKGDVAEYTSKSEFSTAHGRYTYDANRRTLERTLSFDGEFGNRTTFEYNAAGKLIKTTIIDAMGVTEGVCTYKYNNNGLLIATTYDDMTDWDNDEDIFRTYNSQGKLIEYNYSSTVDAYDEMYEYNTKGELTKTKYYWEGRVLYVIYCYYNAQGQLTEKVHYNEENQPTQKIVYQYDSKGNMVKQSVVDVQKKSVTTITQRDIVYR